MRFEPTKQQVVTGSLLATAAVAFADRLVGLDISLGVLYIVPMLAVSTRIGRAGIVAMAIACAALRAAFSAPPSNLEAVLSFLLAFCAYASAGLFLREAVTNRETALEHVAELRRQQDLRERAEEQLRLLAESSPAAIFTLDERQVILAANRATHDMFGLGPGERLEGRTIGGFLPVLADALRITPGKGGFRTAAQCQGYRMSGEPFVAQIWFSTYVSKEGLRLAAIAVDSSEEMREREETNLSQLLQNNRIVAAAVSHELRNLCAAIRTLIARWPDSQAEPRPELRTLSELVSGLEQIARLDLQSRTAVPVPVVSLREILDRLRIIVQPAWQEEEGTATFELPEQIPAVAGDPNGLLQACLNLCQNSLEAVLGWPGERRLTVRVLAAPRSLQLLIEDSGPGIADPSHLFEPFQRGATRVGLGLYISRALIRSYGGELRYVPTARGCRFVIELQTASDEVAAA